MLPLFTKLGCVRNTPQRAQIRTITYSAREPFPLTPKSDNIKESTTTIENTVLDGGVRVLSVDTPAPTTTLSVYVKAGSRYETRQTLNATSFLKHFGLHGTFEKSALRISRDLEYIGASLHTNATRDSIAYHIRGLRFPENTDPVNLNIITETLRFVLNPLLLEYEVERVREVVEHEIEEAASNPQAQLLDLVHQEAFRDTGLGQPVLPSLEFSKNITNQKLHAHLKNYYYPGDRITIIGTGIEHVHLVEKLKPLFVNPTLKGKFAELRRLPPLPEEAPTPQKSVFVGGGALRLLGPGNTELAVAYPGSAVGHKDNIVISVLREILGGGSLGNTSPGEGHTSLLYSKVVEKHDWVSFVSTFQAAHSDAGLFGVYASAAPGHGHALVQAIVDVLKSTVSSITAEDVTRGQRTVINRFLHGLTDRLQLAEHIATVGTPVPEYVSAVRSVTLSDVQRVAKAVLGATPVVAALGDVRGVPRLG